MKHFKEISGGEVLAYGGIYAAGIEGGICTVCGVEMTMDTGIRTTPNPSLNGGEWYDLSGRRLEMKPTQKGIYINHGTKVVVK